MLLQRFRIHGQGRWAADGHLLCDGVSLRLLLGVPHGRLRPLVELLVTEEPVPDEALLSAPIDGDQDVWACGVTYKQSRAAREVESDGNYIYARVYEAERPEIFFKARGSEVVGDGGAVRIRRDSDWDVPEPELVLVVNRAGDVVGYAAGDDLSSRSIEGENPLYLPQAKIWDGACAVGPGIQLIDSVAEIEDVKVTMRIIRGDDLMIDGTSSTSLMKRGMSELVGYLRREMALPYGAFLMTGTGIVPDESFTLHEGDRIDITVGDLVLTNSVEKQRRDFDGSGD